MTLEEQIKKRRTFAIISHPDAGKTTLTEKLLLFGGAVQMAGAVKAKGDARRAKSDWMKVEQERGISVASSVMTFDYNDVTFNLLDTPGHADFSEDTYRTLTAVDSAIMVLDAAKGIEKQTLKLFEVCRLRNIPVITFINKMDREALDSFELMDQIEQKLALDVTPASWPIGMGREFKGCYNLMDDRLFLFDKSRQVLAEKGEACNGLDDPKLVTLLPDHALQTLKEEVEMARGLCPKFDLQAYRDGHMTPVFFGSAVNSFGVGELIQGLTDYAPHPRHQPTAERIIDPLEKKVTGFVFKIQANMDPRHRDRMAFFRICSGHFKKGMKLSHCRTKKTQILHNAQLFLAQDREIAEEAFPGDIIGIPNHGNLRIGDALTEGEMIKFTGIPSFAPELLQRVRAEDPMKNKHLEKALIQLAEEGVARVFKPIFDSSWVVGVVGSLQFDVLADRIRTEYNIPVKFEQTALHTARWVDTPKDSVNNDAASLEMKDFMDNNKANIAFDHDKEPVFLARNAWHLDDMNDKYPKLVFAATREQA